MNSNTFNEILGNLLDHDKLPEQLIPDGNTVCVQEIDYTSEQISIPNYIVNVTGSITWHLIEWTGDRFTPPLCSNDREEVHIDSISLIDENTYFPLFTTKEQRETLEIAIKNLIVLS